MSFPIQPKEFIHYQDNHVQLVTHSERDKIIYDNLRTTQQRLCELFRDYPPIVCTFVPIPHHLLSVRNHYNTSNNNLNNSNSNGGQTNSNTQNTQSCFRASSRSRKVQRSNRKRKPSIIKKPKYTKEEAEEVIRLDLLQTRMCVNCDQPGHKTRQCPSLSCTYCNLSWPSVDTIGRHLNINCPRRSEAK